MLVIAIGLHSAQVILTSGSSFTMAVARRVGIAPTCRESLFANPFLN